MTAINAGLLGRGPWSANVATAQSSNDKFAQEYLGGEPLKGLARRHDISRNLVRLWVAKYEAGELAEEVETAR